MDVFEAIKTRRSVRTFTAQPVSDKEVEKLMEAASSAPSAGNLQPWEFVVVRDPEVKHALCAAALNQTFIENAPLVIVVCANPGRSAQRYESRGIDLYCLQDTAAAAQNILLAAHGLGLAACWVGSFDEEEVGETLGLPPHELRAVAIIPVGHAAEKPRMRMKRSIGEIVHKDRFGRKWR